MDRRRFLKAAAGPTRIAQAATEGGGNPAAGGRPWRRFEIRHGIELAGNGGNGGSARLWVPMAQTAGDYQRAHAPSWSSTADRTALLHEPVHGAGMLRADWDGAGPHTVEPVQIVETRDRLPGDREAQAADPAELRLYHQPTPSMPTDGIVRETALRIVAGIDAPKERLQAIYDWVVDNSFLMSPYAVTAGVEPDCLDPATFRYGITARELPA